METKNDILNMLAAYKRQFPTEENALKSFENFVKKIADDKDLYCRKNEVAHITASAFIINKNSNKVLVLQHKQLDMPLQPGGHIEETDATVIDAVYREVQEETAINKTDLTRMSFFYEDYPMDINSHSIAENKGKKEKAHYHHDFGYVFLYAGEEEAVRIDPEESKYSKWIEFSEICKLSSRFKNIFPKIRHLLAYDFRAKLFYEAIRNYVDVKKEKEDYKLIVVAHLIPDCHYFLRVMNAVYPIVAIIPKPSSIHAETRKKIEKDFPVVDISRKDLLEKNDNEIIRIVENNEHIIVFDIGGYFAKVCDCAVWPKSIYDKIKLIVEDTENGVQKYEKAKRDIAVVSVARSPLKDNEDFLVGQSILFSADALLRQSGNLIQYMKCGVLGYGKIGKSIATHLLQRQVKVAVYDTNPIKEVEAFNNLCSIPSREEIVCKSDVLFCATGNHCLDINDLRKIKNGCFIFSVTSSDDELDLEYLDEYDKKDVGDYITQYYNDTNYFYLVYGGNAVNFIHNAVMDNFIHLVRSEMIIALTWMEEYVNRNKIYSIKAEDRKLIAQIWLDLFDPEHRSFNSVF